MKDYVSVVYDETTKPRTTYPFNMISYLVKRFRLKKGDKILEIGCGRGEFLEVFDKLGLKAYGVDISSFSAQIINKIQVKKVDVSKKKIPYKSNTFDIVYHKSLIEHLYSPENLMKETYRILKPGGIVIILTPDWVSQMKVFYEDFTHSRPYNKTSLQDVLKVYGFSHVRTELFYQLPILWRYPILKSISSVIRFFISTPTARKVTNWTKIKFIRWSAELMVLGYGRKPIKLEVARKGSHKL